MLNSFEKKQINTQAKIDLQKKLKLERTFKPEIKSIFAQMNKDFKIHVAATGQAPSAIDYQSAWEALLYKHYARVQNAFLGSVKLKLFEELLNLALSGYRKLRAKVQSLFIKKTNDKDMVDSVSQAMQSLIEQELPTDNKSVADSASVILKRKTNKRVTAIKTLETQAPAESTKLFEVRTLAGLRPTDTSPVDVFKTWRTIGDIKVRTAHKNANFQTVPLNEPFIVKGQMLMYPGDTSLGATIDNVVN